MVITNTLGANEVEYDFVIVGGGTAGCVIASRLAEELPNERIIVIEAGPSDWQDENILQLKNLLNLLGGDYDYNYTSTEQEFGNSHIVHSRAKVLGGCSSHNGGIAMHPWEYDCKKWAEAGAEGWSFETFTRLVKKLRNTINRIPDGQRNPLVNDWIESASMALGIPVTEDFNSEVVSSARMTAGAVGYLPVTYDPDNGHRSSASVAYIHPIIKKDEKRPNLKILTNAWVNKINVVKDTAAGVDVTLQSGQRITVSAKGETILCAGSIDTPRLMLLSGLGPREDLETVGIPVVRDIPGVGKNLMDHPETIIAWEMNEEIPPQTAMHSDAAVLVRREPANAAGDDGTLPDMMMHIFTVPFDTNLKRLGYTSEQPKTLFSVVPNIPRSRSRGKIYLKSADPKEKPAIDFRYFTDPEGYDEASVVWGLKAARKIAEESPFKGWIKREFAPGPAIQSDKELSEYGRKAGNTVFHPCGTTKMGNIQTDPLAVVDSELRVKGIQMLRIADAGVFPLIPTINLMLTVLAMGERAAEMIVADTIMQTGDVPHDSRL
ncbi:Choline oxidase [Colletotrichum fructicola]|uniref:Choline oxidase n=1 Tax=Colletotrichum fructicola (strain Nara gc5) TaxID=1213859 RepID=A0A7J6IQM7_COLFN|nr:Choline oxidase [Colletotrichum fructicola]KAF4478870.1 Choline oxidase [Colletotrichum fructicola Nara gc5]KAI8291675.1 Choline oxidase [Colletotrichum sp. SAR11_57]KAE9574836.1 Choline oxidase [Colletotrichum fructicola]KAF4422677.1 Choline oxidase [Colletotrichum fructicola]KAF4893885.1 Choline oxidase [Colletotrichum fructicola]